MNQPAAILAKQEKSPAHGNPDYADPTWPPAVVASAYLTGLRLVRNLERRGVRAFSVDHILSNEGFRSVYGKTQACPNPDKDPDAWVLYMVNLAHGLGGKPVLIAAADQYVTAIAKHAETLSKHFRFFASTAPVQASLCQKSTLYELANQFGFPIPQTRVVGSAKDLVKAAAMLRFPCVMKPEQARMWRKLPADHPCYGEKLVLALSADDLIAKYTTVSDYTPNVVIQEEIAGPDTAKYVYLSCYSQNSERLGYAIMRELRTDFPIHYGSACMVEPAADSETESLCDMFLRNLSYRGLCEIEIKRDSRDNNIKLIEANPRYTITSDAAPYDGVDIGWLHYLDLIGCQVRPVKPLLRRFRHVKVCQDIESMRFFVAAGLETWGSVLKSYRPPVYFFDLDPKDWRNFLRTLVAISRTLGGILRRKVMPRHKTAKKRPDIHAI